MFKGINTINIHQPCHVFFQFGLISISTRLTLEIAENNCSSSMNTHINDGFHIMFPSCLDSISMSGTYNLVPVFDHPKPSVSENSTAPKLLKQMTTYTGSYVILCPFYVHFWTRKSRALQVSSVSVSRLSSAWCGDKPWKKDVNQVFKATTL
jgi:hypothetical protein